MQHRAPCPDDPADLSTAWASKLHRIPLSAPHCRFLRLFVVSDNSAQRENVPKATLARRSGFALIASSLPQSGRHVAVLAGRLLPPAPFGIKEIPWRISAPGDRWWITDETLAVAPSIRRAGLSMRPGQTVLGCAREATQRRHAHGSHSLDWGCRSISYGRYYGPVFARAANR